MKLDGFYLHAHKKHRDFSWLLFLLSAVLSVITTVYVSGHYIDSDSSSELVLAQHWIETKNLLSEDWLYGAELRLLHVQLIYAPLMLLLDNWQTVRTVGALIMQMLYIASFGCMVHAAGKSRQFFFRGAALLLLPVSVSYGRIVLYHNHYLPNITIAFLLMALSMHFVNGADWRSWKTWIRLVFLAGVSFGGGLNSIRQLMITHAPLLLIAVALCFLDDAQSHNPGSTAFLKPANLSFLFCCVYSAAFSFFGLKAQGYLCGRLGLQISIQSENNTLSFVGFDNIKEILYGFFHQFGYRNYAPMLSLSGILSLCGIFVGCYLLFFSANRFLKSKASGDRRATLLCVFFFAHVIVMALVFLLTRGAEPRYYYPLYLSLCFSWAVPVLLVNLEELPENLHPLRARKLFAIISVLCLLLSGGVNILYFQGSDRFPQPYEGLGFQNRDKKAELAGIAEFLLEEGYDKGYAVHWECNIMTEITNGRIPMVNLYYSTEDDQKGNIQYNSHLYPLWVRESPCEKPFLLLTKEKLDGFLSSDSVQYCTQIYEDQKHVVFSIDDLEEFADTLRY